MRAALGLWSQGNFDEAYEATTATDIARAAGVSRETFYSTSPARTTSSLR
jgi:AcrR family transcriptional regulator